MSLSVSPLTAAAHELKTPLALISGLASLLLENPDQNFTSQQREYLERILLSSDRMLRVVQGLVDSYRLEQSSFVLNLEPVNIQHVAEEVAHELTPYSQKLQRTITLNIKPRAKMIVANRLLLEEALFNLVDNGIKYNESKQVIIGGRRQTDKTRLYVQNEGATLSKNDFRYLHQRLGEQAQPLPMYVGSSGIGLYIVRQLVEAMGGKIGVHRQRQAASIYVDFHPSTQLALF